MNTYTITRQQLTEMGACAPWLKAFDEAYPDGTATIEWTRENQIALVKGPLRYWLGWAREQGLIPRLDLRGADLRSSDLSGAVLSGVDLRGADLSGANLRGAVLRGADLSGADLWCAYLLGADLWRADLLGADLSGADLRGAALPKDWQNAVAFKP